MAQNSPGSKPGQALDEPEPLASEQVPPSLLDGGWRSHACFRLNDGRLIAFCRRTTQYVEGARVVLGSAEGEVLAFRDINDQYSAAVMSEVRAVGPFSFTFRFPVQMLWRLTVGKGGQGRLGRLMGSNTLTLKGTPGRGWS